MGPDDTRYFDWWKFEGQWDTHTWTFALGIVAYPELRLWIDIGPLLLIFRVTGQRDCFAGEQDDNWIEGTSCES